jgi:hypothetical protein
VNVFNFETMMGNAAKKIFRDSFYLRRFNNASTTAWQSRSPKSKATHALMYETGNLKESIVWRHISGSGDKRGVSIYTDPLAFKHSERQRGRNFCYAAVHNDSSGSHTYGNTGVASIQRQFIGYSSYISDKFKSYSIHIFDGFPK